MDAHTHHPAANPQVYVLSAAELAGQVSPAPFFSAGVHPWHVSRGEWGDVVRWSRHPGCVAIGESGLDRLHPHWERQLSSLGQHWDLSEECGLPLVMHVVRSSSDVLGLLKRRKPRTPWLWHDFTGPLEASPKLMELHPLLYFSCGLRAIRRPNFDVLWKALPHERRLLETDDARVSINEIYHLAQVKWVDLRPTYVRLFPQIPW